MPRGLVIALAAAGVVGVAVVEGMRSNRWGPSEDMREAAARLDRVPREFGDWVGTDSPLDPKVLKAAEAVGSVSRVYTSRRTRDQVAVLLLCGPSGPIGAHTPDVCYGGIGYRCVGRPSSRRLKVGDSPTSFWSARFEKEPPRDSDPLRVYWAWGTGEDWVASEHPRSDFALRPVLYKLYVVHADHRPDRPAADEFLADFIPVVRTALQ